MNLGTILLFPAIFEKNKTLKAKEQSSLKHHIIVHCVTLAAHLVSLGMTKNSYTAESSMLVLDCQKHKLKHKNSIQSKPTDMYFQHEMCTYTNSRLFVASILPQSDSC